MSIIIHSHQITSVLYGTQWIVYYALISIQFQMLVIITQIPGLGQMQPMIHVVSLVYQ